MNLMHNMIHVQRCEGCFGFSQLCQCPPTHEALSKRESDTVARWWLIHGLMSEARAVDVA